jgi:hypothetical protein
MCQKGDNWSKFNQKSPENSRKLAKTPKNVSKIVYFWPKSPKSSQRDSIDPPSKILSPLALGDPRVGGIGQELSQIHPATSPWYGVEEKRPKKWFK